MVATSQSSFSRPRRGRPRKVDSTPHSYSKSSEAPPKKKRGRPPNKSRTAAAGPSPKDVIYLKGAAAQQTTHPGNLNFYSLCEDRYDDFAALVDGHPGRRQICEEIVDEIESAGGTFRKAGGGRMHPDAVIQKVNDRMRQIGRPKIRPDSRIVGENDVVFKIGNANHLFPGNAKWRALLNGYATRYWQDLDSAVKLEIIEEVTSIIHSRGGQFRGVDMTVLPRDEIARKTHSRFKDLKKDLKAGRNFVGATEIADGAADERALGSTVSRTGCTSVKVTVSSGDALDRKRGKQRKVKANGGDDDDDDNSFDSAMLESEHSDEEVEGEDNSRAERRKIIRERDDEWKDMVARRPNRRRQNQDRRERLERRKSARANRTFDCTGKKERKAPPRPKRPRATPREEESYLDLAVPVHELSAYERLRHENIKRNHNRLVELGLAGGYRA